MVTGTRVSHTGVMTQDMTFNLCFLQPWSQHINDCDSGFGMSVVFTSTSWDWYVKKLHHLSCLIILAKITKYGYTYNTVH